LSVVYIVTRARFSAYCLPNILMLIYLFTVSTIIIQDNNAIMPLSFGLHIGIHSVLQTAVIFIQLCVFLRMFGGIFRAFYCKRNRISVWGSF